MILITGANGLIGRHLCVRLEAEGLEIRRFDLRTDLAQDIRDRSALEKALIGVTGVVHLAAVSRVVWAQHDPGLCQTTNVTAVQTLIDLCSEGFKPWVIFSSSREVYGNPLQFPVNEDDALAPVNVYGRSKRDAELIITKAREKGLKANICRFSNVYGCPFDHKDRVVMAFAQRAVHGGEMYLNGGEHMFDFTHVCDVVDGIWRLVEQTNAGLDLPPIHFASGEGKTLRELAELAAARSLHRLKIAEAPPRPFDVSGFVGDPSRATNLLGWSASTPLGAGLSQLISELAAEPIASTTQYRYQTETIAPH